MEYRLIKTLKQITGIALLVDQSIFNLRINSFFYYFTLLSGSL